MVLIYRVSIKSFLDYKHLLQENDVEYIYIYIYIYIGHAVAQLVEALRYKPEGRGFDSRWCQ